GARAWDEVRAPPGAQHSASLRAITARQLQALVRQRAHELRSRPSRARASAPFLDGGRYGRTRAAEIVREHHRYELQVCLEPKKERDRKSTRLNSSHVSISYAVFCLKKKKNKIKKNII